ncbi:MAG TPA: hypothetical protein VF359_04585 [Anaerolineales bacterium]
MIIGSLFEFARPILLGVGIGWELDVFVVGYTLGGRGTGALASFLHRISRRNERWIRLGTTAVVSSLGVLVLLATLAKGFIKSGYPQVGAMIVYYLPTLFLKRHIAELP